MANLGIMAPPRRGGVTPSAQLRLDTKAVVTNATSANELLSAMLDVREQRCSLKDVSKSHPNVTTFQVKTKLDLVSTFLPEGLTKDTLTSLAYSRAMRQAAGVTSYTAAAR
jgi:hypothetical protein